jgi:hypothetical protein
VTEVGAGLVSFDIHHCFLASGEDVVSSSTLRFRELDRLTESLAGAGCAVECAHGDWDHSTITASSPELILVGRKVEAPLTGT